MTGDALIKRLERIRERVTGRLVWSLEELRRIARFELDPLLRESEATAEEYHRRTAYVEMIPIKERQKDPMFHKLHIKNFEKLDQSAKSNPEQIDENDYDDAVIDCRTAIEDVCSEMLLFLEAQPKTQGRQSKARLKGDDRLFYNEIEHILPIGTDHGSLSRAMFTFCQDIGRSVAVDRLCMMLKECDPPTDTVNQYQWAYQTMRSANRWAEREEGLPAMFHMKGRKIVRLI